ncbi:hypothetical protein SAMN04488700_0417 [Carnobacterium iners]|uniref:DUF6671 domain-containing protein n=1 Tax=Carnobacterium iners TaxID=1073423 RepID=A0A1X7MSM6_9LACT|nr:DUF6671 family protein [Carnobacterium iners]SEL13466.1 hypothetical protein SAMN04488114_12911 [Carnobacterium iners]SMH27036.1 hypothetical protein SAMN04488700_0417 [Carnobacterium iners]
MSQEEVVQSLFQNRIAILATMHKKEEVISPLLEKELGIKTIVPEGFDSDKFGTFTGDVERTGDQFEAARRKAEGAMALYSGTLAIASEGTFGPHPFVPFIPFNREIVMLIDKENGIEISGIAMTTETDFKQKVVKSFTEAYEFSLSAGFPKTGIVVKLSEHSKDLGEMIKGITIKEDLEKAVAYALEKSINNEIFIATDMRASYNPKRMKNIEAATRDLLKNIVCLCPSCQWPGYKITDRKKGLPCKWCNYPTELTLSYRYSCGRCGYNEERNYPDGIEQADPGNCQHCNP